MASRVMASKFRVGYHWVIKCKKKKKPLTKNPLRRNADCLTNGLTFITFNSKDETLSLKKYLALIPDLLSSGRRPPMMH